jgi:hypothetical protein
MRSFILSGSFLAVLCFTFPAFADDRPVPSVNGYAYRTDKPASSPPRAFLPRIEAGARVGTERSIGSTEVWMPLHQGDKHVLYGDARLSGDNADNNEGNLGVGYRQMVKDNLILGAHGWIDRRVTKNSSRFNQATLGAEAMGRDMDIRANAYIPLSSPNTVTTANTGRISPYLSGSSVLFDTDGTIIEKPQGGFDIELGYRIPVFEEHIDSIRAYAGAYRFAAKDTETVQGGRVRVAADVTTWLQLGGRYQYDKVRGSQGFLEATFRLPGKASFRDEGLRSRLDESPERDIDIVTSSKVTDTGIGKPVVNPDTGTAQRVIHVDNTNTTTGDGTADNPYKALKTAEAALQPYDVLYIHQGDGTTTWQDQGIVIDKPGVKLIGSGVDLVLSGSTVTGAAHGTVSQNAVIQAATSAPVLTNGSSTTQFITSAGVNEFGHGVAIIANDAYVSGFNINNTIGAGIRLYADSNIGNIDATIANNVTSHAGNSGIIVVATAGATVNVDIHDNTAFLNGSSGIYVQAGASSGATGTLSANISGNNSYSNASDGYTIISRSPGSAVKFNLQGNRSDGNSTYGYQVQSYAALTGVMEGNLAQNNTRYGLYFLSPTGGQSIMFQRNRVVANGRDGIYINDDSTGSINIDMGAGTLGSQGRNSIYSNGTAGNPYRDIVLDLDNGAISAQYNWWGQAGGPIAGRIRNEAACPNCGSADTTNPLSADPGV